jgi:TolB protein
MKEHIKNRTTILLRMIAIGMICCVSINLIAQASQAKMLDNYIAQCSILTRDGGKWMTRNKDYRGVSNLIPKYFGYEYQMGVTTNVLRLKITGYMPDKSQWVILWDGYYTLDNKKQTVVYSSLSFGGLSATGEAVTIDDKHFSFIINITEPNGKMETRRQSQTIETNRIISKSERKNGNKWSLVREDTLARQEQPKGVITFMSTRDGNFEVYSMKTTGDSVVNLTCNKASDYSFSYAPGRRLVFYSNREGNDEIFIMEADGKKVTNLTNNPAGDRIADVSPDGSKIVFSSDREKRTELYVMNIDGSDVRRLTDNDNYEDAPAWSPDGKRIVFSRDVRSEGETSQNIPSNGEIFIVDADGTNEKRLTDRPGFDGGPQFSPDGNRIAFYGKTPEGNYEIFLMNADGTDVINLTEDELEDYSPSWSPDGKWIAYTKGNSANYDVWAIHIETGIKHRLTTQLKRDESPIWYSSK